MTKKRKIIGLVVTVFVIATAAGLIFCGSSKKSPDAVSVPLVQTVTINAGSDRADFTYTGEIRGRYESQLAFRVAGKIIKRLVNVGDHVASGQPLMQIDSTDYVQGATSSAAELAAAEAQYAFAKSNLERNRKMFDEKGISIMQYEQYQTACNNAYALVQKARAGQSVSANQVKYCTLYSDTDGVVATVSAEAGQIVAAGQPVTVVVRDGDREVEIGVPENRIETFRNSETVRLTFWALPGVNREGIVREIAPAVDPASRLYRVRVSVRNATPEILLGMTTTVSASIPRSGSSSVIFVPVGALYQAAGAPSVWVVKGDNVELRAVKLGEVGENSVQIIDGLRSGEIVVAAGAQRLYAGQKVRLQKDGEGL